jgi:hypothetical protein
MREIGFERTESAVSVSITFAQDFTCLPRQGVSRGRGLYSQRIGTVEPVFANIRHNKRLTRLNHRGHARFNTQWHLHCMVLNIEKLSKTKLGRNGDQ